MIMAMPIPPADAHGFQPEGAVGAAQSVDQGAGDPGAAHAEGVTEGDSSTVHVEFVQFDAQVAVAGMTWAANASLISTRSRSSMDRPARASAWRDAWTGP
jgi:hypothetical protein